MAQYTGPFTKGYETLWRGISRYSVIYLVLLIFILYQTAHDARQLMSYLYPELGKPVTKGMHTYDDECDFTIQNLWDNVDHYFAMHLFGWFFATLMIRDTYFLHFWSILDEILGNLFKNYGLTCHRTLLAARSSPFQRMLVGPHHR